MRITMCASEAVPFAKTGGLADVIGALPRALGSMGHEISVIIPYYTKATDYDGTIEQTDQMVGAYIDEHFCEAAVHQVKLDDNVTFYLLKNDEYFGRAGLYGEAGKDYPDNAQRFAFFARAALETIVTMGLAPEIIHAHDWQGALSLYYARMLFDHVFRNTKTVFTIHNIGYQGLFPKDVMADIDLGPEHFTMDRLEFYRKVNYLKGGIVAADAITTVSPTHAEEILTPEYSFGLEGVLALKQDHLRGILNGIDDRVWNPERDSHIEASYSSGALAGKATCKAALQEQLRLPIRNDIPLIGMVGRLATQKGIDLVCKALPEIMARHVQMVILGTGDEKYHKMLTAAMRDFPQSMRLELGFDETLAHRIEAGSDLFLMPSLYEPCGLNQMISMKYGTLPIVRATGGLADTVRNFDQHTWKGNGFVFTGQTPEALLACVNEALVVWSQPVLRNKLIKCAMQQDFSWNHVAANYVELYKSL